MGRYKDRILKQSIGFVRKPGFRSPPQAELSAETPTATRVFGQSLAIPNKSHNNLQKKQLEHPIICPGVIRKVYLPDDRAESTRRLDP